MYLHVLVIMCISTVLFVCGHEVHRTCERPVDPDTCRTVVVGLKGAGGVLSVPSRVAWLVSGGRGKLCSTGSRDRHASPTPTLWGSNWSCNRGEQRCRVCIRVTLTYWGTAYTWFAISFCLQHGSWSLHPVSAGCNQETHVVYSHRTFN